MDTLPSPSAPGVIARLSEAPGHLSRVSNFRRRVQKLPLTQPSPASGEREGPAEREGEGQYAADSGGFAPDSRELEPVIYARGTEVAAFRSR